VHSSFVRNGPFTVALLLLCAVCLRRLWISRLELPPLQLLAGLPQHMAAHGRSRSSPTTRATDAAADRIQRNTLGRLSLQDAAAFQDFMHRCVFLPFCLLGS